MDALERSAALLQVAKVGKFTVGNTAVEVHQVGTTAKGHLKVHATVSREGRSKTDDFVFVNPPLIHAGKKDHRAAFRSILAGVSV